jgi:CRISPR-associated protein Cas2
LRIAGDCLVAERVVENPILNSPFAEPTRHFKFDEEGITNEVVDGRRRSSYFIPIARTLWVPAVTTRTPAGARRLRKVAKICEGYGQRVQDSVFECIVGPADMEMFRARLLKVIVPLEDSLRIYTLHARREDVVEVHGRDLYRDLRLPLII